MKCRFCNGFIVEVQELLFVCPNCAYQFSCNDNAVIDEEFFIFEDNVCCNIIYGQESFITYSAGGAQYHLELSNSSLFLKSIKEVSDFIKNKILLQENIKMLH